MVTGALPRPAKASKPISATSISWSATNLPATSPVPPPTTSTAPAAATPVGLAPLNPALAIFPPTPLANPIVANSIAPIATPLPNALFFNSASFSGFSRIFLTLSTSISSPTSSVNSSEKVNPVSIAVIVPLIAPANPPGIAPIPANKDPPAAPAVPPAAAEAKTSSDRKDPN